jgi:signal peptidase I
MMRPHLRSVVHVLIGLAVAAIIVRTWLVLGLFVPMTVSGSSMAPTLGGPGRLFVCRGCEHRFPVGTDQLPPVGEAWCPACGERLARPSISEPARPGRRLRVDRTAFLLREPRRWEVVVFRCPSDSTQLCVKRTIGLPREAVSLAGGDVFADGQIVRKSLAEQRALRLPVPGLWLDVSTGEHPSFSLSEKRPNRFEFRTPQGAPVSSDWSYNQGAVPAPERVDDLMLTAKSQIAGKGRFVLSLCNSAGCFEAAIDFAGLNLSLHRNGQRLGEAPLLPAEAAGNTTLEWTLSLFDRQALVAAADRVILAVPLPVDRIDNQSPRERGNLVSGQFAISFDGLAGRVEALGAWRDVYYGVRHFDRPRQPGPDRFATWQLGPDEYFVVGDNAAISDDSRNWLPRGGLDAKLLIGKPLGVR